MRVCVALLAICGGASWGVPTAGAAMAPGEADRSFGDRGIALLPTGELFGQDMAVGPEDEIFVLQSSIGCGSGRCARDLSVRRFLPDGSLDTAFGSGGVSAATTTSEASPEYRLRSVLAVGPDGEPVIAAVNGGNITLARFNRDGSRDLGFGSGGTLTVDFGGEESGPLVAIQPDGRIVVAAGSQRPQGFLSVLARFQAGGAPDPSFGAGGGEPGGPGWVTTGGNVMPGALGLSAAGGIALAAPRCCTPGSTSPLYAARRSVDGGLLDGLSPSAPWHSLVLGPSTSVSSVVPLRSGRLYLTGVTRPGGSAEWYRVAFAAKLLPDGRLDRSFGRTGVIRLQRLGANWRGRAPAVVDASGRLLVAGAGYSNGDFAANKARVARLLPSGRSDRTWGGGLSPYAPLTDEISDPIAIGLQSDGRVVVLGERAGGCIRVCAPRPPVLTRLLVSARNRCRGQRATIVGSSRGERLVGTPRRDVIAARAGADIVYGRGGRDLICGGGGNDRLFGGAGRDRVLGGPGENLARP